MNGIDHMAGLHSAYPAFLINIHRVASKADAEDYVARLRALGPALEADIARSEARAARGVMPPKWVYPLVLSDARNTISGAPFDASGVDSPLLADFKAKLGKLDLPAADKAALEAAATAALTASVHGAFLLCYRHQLEGIATLQRIFSTVFGVVYTVIFFGFIARLMYFQADGQTPTGLFLVIYLVMVTKFSDMGAYILGVIFGKHKMIPHISPAKSWEGLVGAFLFSFAGAVLLLWLVPEKLRPLDWLHGLILAPILCATAISGDLAESVLKRCTSIKDSGHKFPGIGGILDLTDSLLFTAPVFYFYLSAIAG